MSGSLTCTTTNICLSADGDLLSATAQKADGSWTTSSINLDRVLGNNDGHFQWGGRNFSHTSFRIHLELDPEQGPMLVARLRCKDPSKSRLDKIALNESIENVNGELKFTNRLFITDSSQRRTQHFLDDPSDDDDHWGLVSSSSRRRQLHRSPYSHRDFGSFSSTSSSSSNRSPVPSDEGSDSDKELVPRSSPRPQSRGRHPRRDSPEPTHLGPGCASPMTLSSRASSIPPIDSRPSSPLIRPFNDIDTEPRITTLDESEADPESTSVNSTDQEIIASSSSENAIYITADTTDEGAGDTQKANATITKLPEPVLVRETSESNQRLDSTTRAPETLPAAIHSKEVYEPHQQALSERSSSSDPFGYSPLASRNTPTLIDPLPEAQPASVQVQAALQQSNTEISLEGDKNIDIEPATSCIDVTPLPELNLFGGPVPGEGSAGLRDYDQNELSSTTATLRRTVPPAPTVRTISTTSLDSLASHLSPPGNNNTLWGASASGTTLQGDTSPEILTDPDSYSYDTRNKRQPKPFEPEVSQAGDEWERQKKDYGVKIKALDELMSLTGLEHVKQQFLTIFAKIEASKVQGTSLKGERFHIVFQGNPGTGKTTVARIYAQFLNEIGKLKTTNMTETSGSKLAHMGPEEAERTVQSLIQGGGGVLFVDEAYQLTQPHAPPQGRQVLDILLTEMENHKDKLVIIFVGYNLEMESFFEHNPGLASRVPYSLTFQDFTDFQLWEILSSLIKKTYKDPKPMEVEDGLDGLYMRIAIRRLGRQSGARGFGNARAVENLLAVISERQAKRLAMERKNASQWRARTEAGLNAPKPDVIDVNYHLFTKEDIIGPDPMEVREKSTAYASLDKLVGLADVKESARAFMDLVETNYRRELLEEKPLDFSLNRVFLGPPGTGKTTVAKLYGQVLVDLGYLTRGEVVMKNPADFIGDCLGRSEARTKAILAATVGKVLIIDEAYMLCSSADDKNDSYRRAVIDTLVAEIQGVPGDDRCVLLLGYEDLMKDMFQAVNPGLSRRFQIDNPFLFKDYETDELAQILDLKTKQSGFDMTPKAREVAVEILERARMRPNFSNASEVDTCLTSAKLNYQARLAKIPPKDRPIDIIFEAQDIDPVFERAELAAQHCRTLLEGRISETIIQKLQGYQIQARTAKLLGLKIREVVPTRFVFKGNPGTGKTTTARQMGQIFYHMGFLSTPEVVECSASELIGQYVGSTGPKTRFQVQKGLGKVLFVDEAYRLATGQYATDAVNEFIHLLSSPKYAGKMVVILGGYTHDMDYLMAARPGLAGHFSEEILFENIPPPTCIDVLKRELNKRQITANFLEDERAKMIRLFQLLSVFPFWANARDIETLAQQMATHVFQSLDPTNIDQSRLILRWETALLCFRNMIDLYRNRCAGKGNVITAPNLSHFQEHEAEDVEGDESNYKTQEDYASQTSTNMETATTTSVSATVAAAPLRLRTDAVASSNAQENPPVSHRTATSSQHNTSLDISTASEEASVLSFPSSFPRGSSVSPSRRDSSHTGIQPQEGAVTNDPNNAIAVQVGRAPDPTVNAEALRREMAMMSKKRGKLKSFMRKKILQQDLCPFGFPWTDTGVCGGGSHFRSTSA